MILKKFKSFFVFKLIAPKSIVSNHAIHILPIFINSTELNLERFPPKLKKFINSENGKLNC